MMASLNYNITWIDRTFHSRSVTEALLAPERESGNISHNDYELATRFLPGPHRHYSVFGGAAAIPVVFAFRKPSWSNSRTFVALFIASITGSLFGRTMALTKHYRFVRSLENPAGFARALDNVQSRTGGATPSGPVIVRADRQPEFSAESANGSGTRHAANFESPAATPQAKSNPVAKWEQIRAMSARSTPSSWDAIRQRQGKAQLSESGVPVHHDGASQPESRPDGKTPEQAEFDAMMERERQISSGNYKEV